MFLLEFFVNFSLYCVKPLTKDLIFYIIFPKVASTTKGTVISNARCRFFDNKKAETVYQSLLFSLIFIKI